MTTDDTCRRTRIDDWDPFEGHPARHRVLAIMCVCLVIVVIAVASLNVAIPTILRDLEPTDSQLLWIVDAYGLCFAGLLLLAGAVGDRFGRKGTLMSGLGVFAAAALAASFATDPATLIACRAVMGVGAAFVMPATLSIVTSVFPPAERPKAIATWAAFAGAGSALGPVVGGFTVEHFGWSSVFLVNLPIVAVALVLINVEVPTSHDAEQRRLDVVGAALSVVALCGLLFGIIQGPDDGWTSPTVLGSFTVALLLAALFVAWELHTDEPMLDPRYFRIPAFRAGSGVITMLFFALFGMFFMITQYLQFVKGYSALVAGICTAPNAAVTLLVTPRSPALVARFGARRVVTAGMLLLATSMAMYTQLTPHAPYWWVALALVVGATGMSIAMAPATIAIVSSLPLSKAGVGSAVNDVTREVGGALGIAVLGTLLAARFTSVMDQRLPTTIPDSARSASRTSMNGAMAVADELGGRAGRQVLEAARWAFTDAMGAAFVVAAFVLCLMAVAAWRAVPDSPSLTTR